MVQPEIISRVACAKYIFIAGVETLDRGAPFASGLAVLAFQDAVEMMLRAVAEHLHAQIKEHSPFLQIIDEIDKVAEVRITHRSALNQLNKARVGFKHEGLEPRDEVARKFRSDLEAFFPSLLKSFLGIDYERISLVSLIARIRIRNWMQESEKLLMADDYEKSIACSAVAMTLYLKTRNFNDRDRDLKRIVTLNFDQSKVGFYREMAELAAAIEEQFSVFDQQLDLIGHGVAYGDYQRYLTLAPTVLITATQRVDVSFHRRGSYSHDDAHFCFTFVQGTILKLQKQYTVKPRYGPRSTGSKLVTTVPTQIIVFPVKQGEVPEVLLDLAAGSELEECSGGSGVEGFQKVLIDGEGAYVSLESVKRME